MNTINEESNEFIKYIKRHIAICLFGFNYEKKYENSDQNGKSDMNNRVQTSYLQTRLAICEGLFSSQKYDDLKEEEKQKILETCNEYYCSNYELKLIGLSYFGINTYEELQMPLAEYETKEKECLEKIEVVRNVIFKMLFEKSADEYKHTTFEKLQAEMLANDFCTGVLEAEIVRDAFYSLA